MEDKQYDIIDSDGTLIESAQSSIPEPVKEMVINQASPQLSDGQLKKARKLYWTIQHPKVVTCGHSLDMGRQPRHRNCEHCWFAWFNEHGEIVQQLDEMYQAEGEKLIIQLQGQKFYHRWRQFMATIARWKEENEQETEGSN